MSKLLDDTIRVSTILINKIEIFCLDLHLFLCKLSEFPICKNTLKIFEKERIILRETCNILKTLFKGCIK